MSEKSSEVLLMRAEGQGMKLRFNKTGLGISAGNAV